MSRGRIPARTSSMTATPASLASRSRAASTAGMVPFPGRASPRASIMQFMVLAVNIPAQEPQPGQQASSISLSSSSEQRPAAWRPTASKAEERSMSRPSNRPAIMGPPLTTRDGMLSRAAAMAMPGMILSQLVSRRSPSRACPWAMISMESAMSSRLGRENFIPRWFMAMPSQTPMTGNSRGRPPAA